MASIVGEATITLSFDGKELTAQLQETENKFRNKGTTSGQIWGNAWTVAAGNLISKGIGKIVDSISSNLDSAIKRVDTIANSNKVFTAMGYAADDVSASMNSLTSYLDGLPTSMTTAVSAVQSLSASFGGIEKGTQTFIDMNNAGLAFGATSDQIENAIMQLGQLSLDGPLDAQTWNSLRNSGFSPVFAAMAKEAGITVGELKEQFGGHGDKTVGDFLDTLHKLNTEGGGDMESLADLAKANTNGIGTAMENVQNRISKAIAKVIDHIGQENISGMINDFSSKLSDVADVVIKIFDFLSANKWILEFFGTMVGIAIAIGAAIWVINAAMAVNPITWIVLGVSALIALIVVLIKHWDEVWETIKSGAEAIGQVLSDFWEGIKEGLAKIGQWFSDTFEKIWEKIKEIFGNIVGFFQGIWDKITSIFTTIGSAIGDAVGKAFKTVVNSVIGFAENFLNTPIRAINTLIDVINAVPGISVGKLSELSFPRLAQGGITTRPTAALIGEAGKEAVIPLERNTENWTAPLAKALAEQFESEGISTDGRITVNMNNYINNNLDADEIGQRLMTSIRRAA